MCIDGAVTSLRVLLVPLVAVACQVLAGIETREESRAAASSGSAGSGGAASQGGATGESGAPGASGGVAGDGAGGEGPDPAVCGDGVQADPEACDDGAENGQTGKCDVS